MKNILYSLLAFFLMGNVAFAQLMSDEQHRIMMNAYTTNLNNILAPYATQYAMTIDQFKREVVNGQLSLSTTAQNSITGYAADLKNYGAAFAAAKGLSAPNDNYKYFYAAFSPSTVVLDGKLVENTTTAGLTAAEMWDCALSSFTTSNCGGSALVSDKNDIYKLATVSIDKFPSNARTLDLLLMTNGFGDCTDKENFDKIIIGKSSYVIKTDNLIAKYINNQKIYEFDVLDLNMNNIVTTEIDNDLVVENIISNDVIRLSNFVIVNDNVCTFDFFNIEGAKIGNIRLESIEPMMLPPQYWPKIIKYLAPIIKSVIDNIGSPDDSECLRAYNACLNGGGRPKLKHSTRDTFFGTEDICEVECK